MKKESILFSVVIPAYNAENYIKRTLDSVKGQTYDNYKILITNDGSKDNTQAAIVDYSHQNPSSPIFLENQTNGGIGKARNNGLFRSKGDFIAFLDADDFWYPSKLNTIARFLTNHPEIDVVYHDIMEVEKNGRKHRIHLGTLRSPFFDDLLFNRNRLATSATVVRRELAQKLGGFSENLSFNSAEDHEFWIRIAKEGAQFAYLPEVLSEYYRSEQSITAKIDYHCDNCLNVRSYHLDILRRENRYTSDFLEKMSHKFTTEFYYSKARLFKNNGNYKDAWDYYKKAVMNSPAYLKTYGGILLLAWDMSFKRKKRTTCAESQES